jgi:hypothetical protein
LGIQSPNKLICGEVVFFVDALSGLDLPAPFQGEIKEIKDSFFW